MAESNPYDPRTQPAEWQQWLNERIAEHDAKPGNEPRNDKPNDKK